MKKIIYIFMLVLFSISLISCGSSYDKENTDPSIINNNDFSENNTDDNDLIIQETTRKIVYTVNMNIRSKNVSKDITSINGLVKEFGGYIEHSSASYNDDGSMSRGNYCFRIPSNKLTDFLDGLDKGFNVTNKDMSSKDITNTYNETEARIETLKESRKVYENLLSKATSYREIMEIQQYLSDIDAKLLTYSKTKQNYDELVNYSVVNLTISEKYSYKEPTFMEEYVDYLKGFVQFIFRFTMYTLPFAAIGGIVLACILIPKKIRRKRQ